MTYTAEMFPGRWVVKPRAEVAHYVRDNYHTSACGLGTAWDHEWTPDDQKRRCRKCTLLVTPDEAGPNWPSARRAVPQ